MIRPGGFRRFAPALIAALALGACASSGPPSYDGYVEHLKRNGKFRTEVNPSDAPFDNVDLERNFIEIALNTEFNDANEAARTPIPLRRWEGPIRYRLFGARVGPEDEAVVRLLAARLERLTGRRMVPVEEDVNFAIMILDADGRQTTTRILADRWGESAVSFQRLWARRNDLPCVASTFTGDQGGIGFALAMIKDEAKGLLRESCIHEEVVQALGLLNDSFDVRPSIFNDDEEFALLTRHDEYLLRILYDDRLTSGMTEAEVRRRLPAIIADLRPEGLS